MKIKQLPIGNCTSEEVIEKLFGSVTDFAQLVEEHGDNFTYNGVKVVYDAKKDIHWFCLIKQEFN
jgi:hypothetical protein